MDKRKTGNNESASNRGRTRDKGGGVFFFFLLLLLLFVLVYKKIILLLLLFYSKCYFDREKGHTGSSIIYSGSFVYL